MDKTTRETLQVIADELKAKKARTAATECRFLDETTRGVGGMSEEDRRTHEWMLGVFSGISGALEFVEGFIADSGVDECKSA